MDKMAVQEGQTHSPLHHVALVAEEAEVVMLGVSIYGIETC